MYITFFTKGKHVLKIPEETVEKIHTQFISLHLLQIFSQSAFTCSKSIIESPEQCVKYA